MDNQAFLELCKTVQGTTIVWRSKIHSKVNFHGRQSWPGIFILGIHTEQGKQITFHLPEDKWDKCNFARTFSVAPDYDGHSQQDVLERIKNINPNSKYEN